MAVYRFDTVQSECRITAYFIYFFNNIKIGRVLPMNCTNFCLYNLFKFVLIYWLLSAVVSSETFDNALSPGNETEEETETEVIISQSASLSTEETETEGIISESSSLSTEETKSDGISESASFSTVLFSDTYPTSTFKSIVVLANRTTLKITSAATNRTTLPDITPATNRTIPVPLPPPVQPPDKKKDSSDLPMYIGIGVGSFMVIVIVMGVGFFLAQRRKKRKAQKKLLKQLRKEERAEKRKKKKSKVKEEKPPPELPRASVTVTESESVTKTPPKSPTSKSSIETKVADHHPVEMSHKKAGEAHSFYRNLSLPPLLAHKAADDTHYPMIQGGTKGKRASRQSSSESTTKVGKTMYDGSNLMASKIQSESTRPKQSKYGKTVAHGAASNRTRAPTLLTMSPGAVRPGVASDRTRAPTLITMSPGSTRPGATSDQTKAPKLQTTNPDTIRLDSTVYSKTSSPSKSLATSNYFTDSKK